MYSLLNILGLGVGMASCLLIAFHVSEQTSYDKFYREYQNVYRLTTYQKQEEGEKHYATTPPLLGPLLKEQSPYVQSIVRINQGSDLTMRSMDDVENPFRETNAWTVEKTFFEVLDYGLIDGDVETLFTEPHTLVMTKSTAIRYFGQEDLEAGNIVGRMLGGGGDGGTPWKVVGLMEDQPKTSHFQFDMLISRENPEAINIPNWDWNHFHTYIRLSNNDSEKLRAVEETLEHIVTRHAISSSGISLNYLREKGLEWKYNLQPIADIHLTPSLIREMRPKGNRLYVNSLIAVAIFIMMLACVNFVNLSTARSTIRAKEIGVKKVLGSGRKRLIYQFLTESVVFAFTALLLALGLVEEVKILLKNFSDWHLSTSMLSSPLVWLTILSITVLIGVLAGTYPAIYLTSFKPVSVLKGKANRTNSKSAVRNLLVVFQFVVSISLIISALVIRNQVEFTQSSDLGFDKENILVIHNDREIDDRRQEFKTLVTKTLDIESATFTTGLPGQLRYAQRDFSLDGDINKTGINWYKVDDDYVKTLGLELSDGRSFNASITTDSSGVLLNESAVKELGLSDPVGAYVTINKGDTDEARAKVIGVLKDFNLESFDKKIEPLALSFLDDDRFKDFIAIKINPQSLDETIHNVEKAWKELEPTVPLVYSFLDQDFNRLFKSEKQLSRIFSAFTMLAIFIACLGLFGLAAYVNEQRTKEIGIRKVLGASLFSILVLLYKSYFKLILLAFVLAGTLSFYFMSDWLQGFAYRISLDATPFLIALSGTVLLAGITVAYQSIMTAYKNPVDTLKSE